MEEDKEGIGCFGWLGILSWALFLVLFLAYVTSDENEVFGYFDVLGIIILGSPIVYLTKLYKKDNISFLVKFILITTLFFSLIVLLGVINRIFKGEENIGHNYIFFYSSFAFLSSSLLILIAYYKPWIKKKNTIAEYKSWTVSKNTLAKKEKAFKKLNSEGQKEVLKANTDFIEKMKIVHGNKFDYSNVIVEEFLGVDLKSNSVKIKYHDFIKLSCNEHNFNFIESLQEVFITEGCERCKLDKRHKEALKKKENKRTKGVSPKTEIINHLKDIKDDVDEIKGDGKKTLKTVNRIDKNMDVLAKIEDLKINSDDTNIEETISNIVNLIKDKYDFKDVKEYIESVTKWFKYWDKLEVLSQNFMVQSEYLYSSIKSSEFDDYSPFVLYSCRALEYELLQKIFVGYHDYINAKYTEKEILFDYNKESLNSKTVKDIETGIINSFKRYIISGNPKYTLGDMRLLLNILPSKSKPKGSKRFQALLALQELNDFIETKIGDIPSKFIKDIENISSNYRNPSAHIGVINKQKADEFYEIYKKIMNDLLSGFDQPNISL